MRIYLETTIFNRYLESGREYCEETRQLFARFEASIDEPYTSVAVIEEIEKSGDPKRTNMLNLVSQYKVRVLEITDEVYKLTDTYIETEIIPKRFRYDGIHIAMAAVNNMDCIVSLNFRHINKLNTKTGVRVVNLLRGYSNPDICTPMEVVEYEK